MSTASTHTFELRSLPDDKGKPRLFMQQLPIKTDMLPPVDVPTTIARLEGQALKLALPAVAQVLNVDQATMEAAVAEASAPTLVSEANAIRLGLIFNVGNSMRSAERMQRIVLCITEMPEHEAIFWLKKLVADPTDNTRKAMVVMVLGDL